MSKKPTSSRIREVVFGILSFFLSLLFTMFSFSLVIGSTVLNKNAWIDSMNRCGYFNDKTTEVCNKLRDLTYASGLKALDDYIKETGQKASAEQVSELVKQAEHVYTATVSFVGIGAISVYFLAAKKALPFVLAGIIILALGLIAVLFFCNKWKHRAMKFYYYATAGAFLANFALALFMTVNKGAKNINLEYRSVYNFVVSFVNSVNVMFWICTALFLLLSVALFFVYRRLFYKASKKSST